PEEQKAGSLGVFSTVIYFIFAGLLQVLFVVTAWWKLWIVFILVSTIWGILSWRVYLGSDILGDRTNGRLFYSGIRADLKKVASNGAPDVLVQGLACLRSKTITEAKYSALGKALEEFGVANTTNLKLTGIILEHAELPAYVASRNEHQLLSNYFEGINLLDNSVALIKSTLSIYQSYLAGEEPENADVRVHIDPNTGPITSDQYHLLLSRSFDRVLTAEMKSSIAKLSATQLATIILSYEAGKAMAYGKEGPRWVRSSAFPQLCARATVHSIAEFSKEYDYFERENIRRALIYASRESVFGPVKFAVDLSDESRAARQWVELLMACPHELEAVTDEVELVGIVGERHALWTQKVFDKVMTSHKDFTDGIYTYSNLFFVPFANVVRTLREVTPAPIVKRLGELVETVSKR
ncbi:MAG: hypothetical protein KDD53_11965, partial [Bdellovibrionales bacterium]|nr:hypothetical protein [Bdellovibrionales bacterium]